MNREQIIQMARAAGIEAEKDTLCRNEGWVEPLEHFAALVADAEAKRIHDEGMVTVGLMREQIAKEREACAKACDELHCPWHMGDNSSPKDCAAAIRARGQA